LAALMKMRRFSPRALLPHEIVERLGTQRGVDVVGLARAGQDSVVRHAIRA
jgi:hypothetical protein